MVLATSARQRISKLKFSIIHERGMACSKHINIIRNNTNYAARKQHKKNSNSKYVTNDESIKKSAKELEALFQIDSSTSTILAKELSSSARKEISQAQRNLRTTATISEPSKRDLQIHALTQGIPFIGFGIMDNAILIWAGDKIDTHLGILFGISTLCAAAIGNIISDVAGVGLGAYIEDFCARKLALPKINLSNAQRNLRSVRMAGQWGNCIGITIGCIIGMFPLLLIDTEAVQRRKLNHKLVGIFRDVMNEAKGLVAAESTCLFIIVDDKDSTMPAHYHGKQEESIYQQRFLYGESCDGEGGQKLCWPVERGLVSKAAIKGEILNVQE
jgi:tRNA-specific adenosine deaminase 1